MPVAFPAPTKKINNCKPKPRTPNAHAHGFAPPPHVCQAAVHLDYL